MKLVWKLLRQHISTQQFAGFFLANLVGMLIILLGIQFYIDFQSVYDNEDSFMKSDYIILNKKVGTLSSLTGKGNTFSKDEIEDIEDQRFVKKVGVFTSSNFDVSCSFDIQGLTRFSTDMFFESVDDEYVDISADKWRYREGDKEIPIILPKDYLDLYNFGFAQSRSLPRLSEGVLGAMKLNIAISGNDKQDIYTGRIVGFSSRLNTIVVPQTFMKWANSTYSPDEKGDHTRLIVEVDNPTDKNLSKYIEEHDYETDQDKLKASKTTFFLRLIVGIVMGVGIVICILSFYILMLSVYLLVQKNTTKLENLLMIGYSPAKVSLPYQLLTVGLNLVVFVLAWVILLVIRHIYFNAFETMFPNCVKPSMMITLVAGLIILVVVSVLNVTAVHKKVMDVWKHKE